MWHDKPNLHTTGISSDYYDSIVLVYCTLSSLITLEHLFKGQTFVGHAHTAHWADRINEADSATYTRDYASS